MRLEGDLRATETELTNRCVCLGVFVAECRIDSPLTSAYMSHHTTSHPPLPPPPQHARSMTLNHQTLTSTLVLCVTPTHTPTHHPQVA